MSGTGFAIPGKQFAEMLSCTVQPDGEIVSRQAKILRSPLGILAIEIDTLDQFAEVFRNGWQQSIEALAKNLFIVRIGRFRQFTLELFQCSLSRCIATVEINDGIPQNPVKPCDGVFFAGRLIRRFERFHQTLLHQILCQMRISDTIAGEGGEGVKILDQGFFKPIHAASMKRQMRRVKPRQFHELKKSDKQVQSPTILKIKKTDKGAIATADTILIPHTKIQ